MSTCNNVSAAGCLSDITDSSCCLLQDFLCWSFSTALYNFVKYYWKLPHNCLVHQFMLGRATPPACLWFWRVGHLVRTLSVGRVPKNRSWISPFCLSVRLKIQSQKDQQVWEEFPYLRCLRYFPYPELSN